MRNGYEQTSLTDDVEENNVDRMTENEYQETQPWLMGLLVTSLVRIVPFIFLKISNFPALLTLIGTSLSLCAAPNLRKDEIVYTTY